MLGEKLKRNLNDLQICLHELVQQNPEAKNFEDVLQSYISDGILSRIVMKADKVSYEAHRGFLIFGGHGWEFRLQYDGSADFEIGDNFRVFNSCADIPDDVREYFGAA